MVTRIVALAIVVIAFERSKLLHVEAHPTTSEQQNLSATNQNVKPYEPPELIANTAAASPRSLGQNSLTRNDHRRPIWALAHMVNSIKELDYRLKTGANGVEADVTFNREGEPIYTYHGPPCDCWRHCNQQEDFNDYLSFIREVSIDSADGIGQNLTLLFLDLKLDPLDQRAKERAGYELAKSVLNNLFISDNQQQQQQVLGQTKFRLIVSINHVHDIDLVRNFIHTLETSNSSHLLNENIGFDVGMNDDLQQIESMWHKLTSNNNNGVGLNLWQGDGFTNCLSPFQNLGRLSRALSKRDAPEGFPAKVYHWTIDLHDRIRESLLMGVDAIMTNHPERLITVLKEPTLAHDLRLATRDDNPFRKLTRRMVGRSNETARYQRSAYTQNGGFLYSVIDVVASWLNYVREIPFLSYPASLVSRRSSSTLAKHRQVVGKSAPATTVAAATGITNSINVTRVGFQSEPVYKVMVNATDITANQERQSGVSQSSDSEPIVASPSDPYPEYEGPKWYTSLVSSVLVSIMRVLMPVN